MTPDESSQETKDMPAVEPAAVAESPMAAHHASAGDSDPVPLVGAAFVGGFVLAKILKRLGGGD